MMLRLDELKKSNIEADLCIIGCGAAGICLAHELAGTGLRIVLLEAGELAVTDVQQKFFESHVDGLPYDSTTTRFRVVGGSTERWGGQALPFDPIDFIKRDWVPHSGWDITYQEVAQYFARVENFMGVQGFSFDKDLHAAAGVSGRFDPAIIHYQYTKIAPEPRMAVRHRRLLTEHADLTVLWDASVTDMAIDEASGRITHASVSSLAGHRVQVRAATFVLAAGALEIARLLLACRSQRPQGLGNEHDLVGRFLQDHPGLWVGEVATSQPSLLCRYGGLMRQGPIECLKRLSAAEELQTRTQTLNASATILFEFQPDDPLLKIRDEIRFARSQKLGLRRKLAVATRLLHPAHLSRLARGAVFKARSGSNWNYGTRFVLALGCEQEPDPASRVTLAEDLDFLGLPRLRVCWTVTPSVMRTLRQYSLAVAAELRRLGLGPTNFHSPLHIEAGADGGGPLPVLPNCHHMGTTRMAASPQAGVVDTSCRVHSIANLFIAGASVFPTSGHSNPTFTALALTIRLADHLRKRHDRGGISQPVLT